MSTKQTTEEKILETLEKLLRVTSLQVGSDKSVTERVGLLKVAGLDNQTIGKILNVSDEVVRALAYQSKKKRKK